MMNNITIIILDDIKYYICYYEALFTAEIIGSPLTSNCTVGFFFAKNPNET